MHTVGKTPLKIAFSSSRRRFRLGLGHHGAPAPVTPIATQKGGKKR